MKNECILCKRVLSKNNHVRHEFCRYCFRKGRADGSISKLEKKQMPSALSSFQEEILFGSLLGDGSLGIHKNGINPVFEIGRSILDKEYLLYEYSIFTDFCTDKALYHKSRIDPRSGFVSKSIGFRTRATDIFNHYYDSWYKNRKKKVPEKLNLTPLIIAIWLADDGCVGLQPHTKSNRLRLNFATNSFSKEEVIYLISLLNDRYSEKFRLVRRNRISEQFLIEASDKATRVLLRDIDSYFPDSMNRKSSIWRDEKVRLFDLDYKVFNSHKE